jgi:hypothetical protein
MELSLGMARKIVDIHDRVGEDRLALTGSQFFGTAHAGSDIDYFTDNIEVDLSDAGFIKVKDNTYADSQTLYVWRDMEYGIDIQVVKNFGLKFMAQQYLKDFKIDKLNQGYIAKAEWRFMWEEAFRTVRYFWDLSNQHKYKD